MVTTDRLLTALKFYLIDRELSPDGVEPRLRDWSGVQSTTEVVVDCEEGEEHEILRGVVTVEGSVMLQVSVADTPDDVRRALLDDLAELADVADAMAWMSDAASERGLDEGAGLTVYDFRMAGQGDWEIEGDRAVGRLGWMAVCAPVQALVDAEDIFGVDEEEEEVLGV